VFGGTVVGGALLWAWAIPGAEPHATPWATLGPRGWVGAGGVAAFVAVFAGAVVLLARGRARSLLDGAGTRAVMLSLVPWTIVALAWAPLAALHGLGSPGVSIRSGWEPWMGSTLVAVLGSWWWLAAAAILYVWLLRHASWRLERLFSAEAPVCPGCGYDLKGAPAENVCPECGLARGEGSGTAVLRR
jgi:hypothetical protein